ncbi:MAG: proline dehydrogenase family protein [Actinomycetota bacterium]
MTGPFLRAPVLRLARARWFRRVATGRLGWLVASRFVAGDSLDDAIATARSMRERGCATILDHLGESVTAPEHAAEAVAAYLRALDGIGAEGLEVTISVKLTQLGLDFSTELATSNLERVVATVGGRVVMVDMESSEHVDRTLEVFRRLRDRTDRVGVCLQACLHRTPDDVEALPEASIVRLVKGAYLEPPDVAIQERREVDRAFARLTATLLARGHTVHVATHDPALLEGACSLVERTGTPWSRVDLQFLLGVRRDLQAGYADRGIPVTVYVPYGTEWYPYLTRRLAERPANMWFFLSNLLRVRH